MSELFIQGHVVLVDDDDLNFINQFNWYIKDGYVACSRQFGLTTAYLHRVLLQASEKQIVDHANRNTLDNQKSNLRVCSSSQNNRNRPGTSNSRSAFKGVHFDKTRGKWRSQIYIDGRNHHVGYFDNEESAALAYNVYAATHFKEFGWLNHVGRD